jgi:hypothetical protein
MMTMTGPWNKNSAKYKLVGDVAETESKFGRQTQQSATLPWQTKNPYVKGCVWLICNSICKYINQQLCQLIQIELNEQKNYEIELLYYL